MHLRDEIIREILDQRRRYGPPNGRNGPLGRPCSPSTHGLQLFHQVTDKMLANMPSSAPLGSGCARASPWCEPRWRPGPRSCSGAVAGGFVPHEGGDVTCFLDGPRRRRHRVDTRTASRSPYRAAGSLHLMMYLQGNRERLGLERCSAAGRPPRHQHIMETNHWQAGHREHRPRRVVHGRSCPRCPTTWTRSIFGCAFRTSRDFALDCTVLFGQSGWWKSRASPCAQRRTRSAKTGSPPSGSVTSI